MDSTVIITTGILLPALMPSTIRMSRNAQPVRNAVTTLTMLTMSLGRIIGLLQFRCTRFQRDFRRRAVHLPDMGFDQNEGATYACYSVVFRRAALHRGLERLDLLKPEDRAALTVYTETWSTYVAAMVRIRAECLTLVNPDSGHTSAHPCVVIAHSAGQQLLRYSSELGLSPVAERKLGSITPDDDEHSPFSGG